MKGIIRLGRDRLLGRNVHKDSIARRFWDSGEPLIILHTHEVTDEILDVVIREKRSIDLDIAIDGSGTPYLGHSLANYKKNNISPHDSVPLEHALSRLERNTSILVHLDCKEAGAFTAVLDAAERLGPRRCIINSFVNELDYITPTNSHMWGTYVEEDWMSIATLRGAKKRFPKITVQASGEGVTVESLLADDGKILQEIIHILGTDIDSVNLNIPSAESVPNEVISAINDAGIFYHVNIDSLREEPQGLYIGETDDIAKTTAPFHRKLSASVKEKLTLLRFSKRRARA